MLKASLTMVLLELRGRKAYRIILLAPIALALFTFLAGTREANYGSEGLLRSEAGIASEMTSAGESAKDNEDLNRRKEDLARERLAYLGMQSIFSAPNSIQMFAQTMVSGGTLFAFILGVLGSGTAVAYGFMKTAAIRSPSRLHLLVPYYLAPLILWGLVTVVTVILALIAGGLIAPLLLDLKGAVVQNSVFNLLLAAAGAWLAGAVWCTVGVSLMVVTRSRSVAIIAGVIILVGENIVGSVVPAIQPWLPTFGAVELVSVNAPRLYHGLGLLAGAHPSNPPQVVVGTFILIAVGIVAASIGAYKFSKADIV